jgi:ribosome-associated translation inhibitor RaiA
MTTAQSLPVRTGIRGRVPEGADEIAVTKVRSALRHVARPILSARITLAVSADPAVARPAGAQVTVDVNGRIVRAEAVGRTVHEAIENMSDRLRTRLDRASYRRETRPRRTGRGGSCRRGPASAR